MNTDASEIRLRRLKYRANHRGIKEMDIILGGFADSELDALEPEEVNSFEALMEHHDRDLLVWFTGEAEFPHDELSEIFTKVSEQVRGRFNNV